MLIINFITVSILNIYTKYTPWKPVQPAAPLAIGYAYDLDPTDE